MTNSLQLSLLGSPEVRLNGQTVTGFRSSKAQALLYYLAVTGRFRTRTTLAGLFWGDQPEAAARTSLSKCLSNLRELVGDAVLVERQTVAFNRHQPYHLDTEHFLTGIGQPPTPETSPTWQAALALYRGDFLEGFYVRDAPDFEQWVLAQRAHYREAAVQGLHTLANYCDQQGDLFSAITHTRRLLTLEPWREEAHRQLMIRLARSGQRTAALAQFESCRRILDEELAVEPDAEMVTLVEAIRAGEFDQVNTPPSHPVTLTSVSSVEPSPPHPVLPTLPIPPTPLIGRERELAELGELISNPQCRLITIIGAGGMGKTRLALAAAAAQGERFQHGAVFVALAGVSSAQFLPQAILSALNLPLQETLSPQQQVRAVLLHQQCLLVLDNYEQLLPDVELLFDLLQYAPRLTLLVTSRERLSLQAEYLSELTGLAYPAPAPRPHTTESAHNLTTYAALQLFLQRVRQIQPRFTPSAVEVMAIAQICRKLDGIPLAIELAAARVRILPVEQIATRLHDSLNLLTTGNRTAPPRHQTLRATIDWSYDLLADAERMLLRRLAVFAGSFSFEAVEGVCGTLPTSVVDLLAHLVDKSLLMVERHEDEVFYRLLDTIREYAYAKLQAAGEEAHLRMSHLNFYIQFAEAAQPQLSGSELGHGLTQLECAHDNVRVALSWALAQGKRVDALRLSGAMASFWKARGYWHEGRQWLAQALNDGAGSNIKIADHTVVWVAKALSEAGILAWRQCDLAVAHELLEKSLTLYRQLDNRDGLAHVLGALSAVAFVQGKYAATLALIDEILAVRRAAGYKDRPGVFLFNLGIVALNQGEYVTARKYLEESLKLERAANYAVGIYNVLHALGNLANMQEEYETAWALYQESLALQRELGAEAVVAQTLNNMANLTAKQGDYGAAQTLYQESLILSRKLGGQHSMVCALSGLARIRQAQGNLHLAARLLGAVEALLITMSARLEEPEHSDKERAVASLHTQLDAASFHTAWEEGLKFTLEQAITIARQAAE